MLTDVFLTLLYPRGTGPVCPLIMRDLWLLLRKLTGRASTIAAPAAMAVSYALHHRHRQARPE